MKNFLIFLLCSVLSVSSHAYEFKRLTPDFSANYTPELSGTEAGLWMQMDEAEKNIKHSPLRINNDNLNVYLNSILCRLSEEYCADFRIYIIRNPYFNATMAPNGMMQIWSGLLLRARNEAQLATVIGHEIGHYLKQHSLKRFNDINAKSSFMSFLSLGIAGAVATGNLSADIGSAASDLTQLGLMASIFSYSRDNEREADQYGIQLLENAGLDNREAAKIWENLIAEKEAADEDISSGSVFFASHPDPGERIINLNNHANAINQAGKIFTNTNSGIYWQNIKPILPLLYQDELNLRQFKQSEYVFKSLLKDDISPGLTHFYLGELYRLNGEDEQQHLVKSHYQQSINYPDHPSEVYRSLGLIEYKSRNFSKAKEYFTSYLDKNPEANDKEMIEFYMNFGA